LEVLRKVFENRFGGLENSFTFATPIKTVR